MEEDWFLYCITLFTFAVIFTFCYIRRVFTFFERNRLETASYPGFPFGNVYDVVFHKTPMFMLLWKFHNKLKRRKCKLGGFYMFLSPAVVVVDDKLAQKVATSDCFRNPEGEDCGDFNDAVKQEMLNAVLGIVQRVCGNNVQKIERTEENFSRLLDKNAEEAIREFFDCRAADHLKPYFRSNFNKLLSLCCPKLGCFLNTTDNVNQSVLSAIDYRKKNDIKSDDILQIVHANCPHDQIVNNVQILVDYFTKSNNLILFALYELSLNKEIQEDVRGEIARFKKHKNITSVGDLNELSYLETIVCETLRKFPLSPFVHKICRNEFVANGTKLSEDLVVFISTFGIHHDSLNYTNPELFDPDRFSEENVKYIDPCKYLPFGYTNGDNFVACYVKMLLKLTLIELLSKYEFSLGAKSPKSLEFDEHVFELKPKHDVWFKVNKVK